MQKGHVIFGQGIQYQDVRKLIATSPEIFPSHVIPYLIQFRDDIFDDDEISDNKPILYNEDLIWHEYFTLAEAQTRRPNYETSIAIRFGYTK